MWAQGSQCLWRRSLFYGGPFLFLPAFSRPTFVCGSSLLRRDEKKSCRLTGWEVDGGSVAAVTRFACGWMCEQASAGSEDKAQAHRAPLCCPRTFAKKRQEHVLIG
ncbi:hypothetical protein TW95_gp0057 [Pandoravirus inopinatum]|uniref:Uncharacterized protein n=1 Tax=Pandoravirus inopinatum TaxID=1605721 RepID=A0A0B5J7Q9_9VIRU|nr:hypothetical protein TW95_gp0057 [Pandoravirus inopinatum]AJF96791.1 hypothetical protein [Pandoravirus inopinatum]